MNVIKPPSGREVAPYGIPLMEGPACGSFHRREPQNVKTEFVKLFRQLIKSPKSESHGFPFPDEIRALRELYGLSASKMSEILGLGANQYRLYENGEIPSEAIGKTLKSIMSPMVFSTYVHNAENQFSAQDFAKICDKLEQAIKRIEDTPVVRIYNMVKRSSITGYAPQSQSKIKNILLYFIEKLGGVFTRRNKMASKQC